MLVGMDWVFNGNVKPTVACSYLVGEALTKTGLHLEAWYQNGF